MATLTYDPAETQEGELTEDEKDSLEVGEKMAEQQEQMLAGKFKTAEDLEQGYIELQKKLGETKEESSEPEEKPEAKEEKTDEVDTSFLETLWEEAISDKDFSKETLEKLSELDSREIAQMYLKSRSEQPEPEEATPSALTQENVNDLKSIPGGEEEYGNMMQWAGNNLQKQEIEMFDAVMDRGDPLAAFFAVQALTYRYNDTKATDGKMLTGKASKAEGTSFRSQAEVVKAMTDPRYDKDPAYRQDIYDKLERSNLQF